MQWHTVKRGETLQSIANALRVRKSDLAEAAIVEAHELLLRAPAPAALELA